MHFATNALLLAGLAAAQSNVVKIVSLPQNGFSVGEDGTIGWSTTDSTDPIEIVLKEPDAANTAVLNPSPIATIVQGANPSLSSVQFKPTACGTGVALEILQGKETNYAGPFDIAGACSSTSASVSSTSAPVSAPTYGSSSVTSSASTPIITSSSSLSSYNATTSVVASNITTTAAPAPVNPSSNKPATFSTLTPYRNSSATTTGVQSLPSTAAPTTSKPISAPASGASSLTGPLSLVLGVFAAVAYLA